VVVLLGGLGVALGRPAPTGEVAGLTGTPNVRSSAAAAAVSGSPPSSFASASPPHPAPSEIPSPTAVASAGQATLVATTVRYGLDPVAGVRIHLVAAIENRSSSSVRIVPSDAVFRVIEDRTVVTGRFRYAIPSVIAPGERAYFIDTVNGNPGTAPSRPRLEVTLGQVDRVPGTPERLLVENITWDVVGGLRVRGTVTNTLGRAILQGVLGAVAFDRQGRPICGLVDLTDVSPLGDNESRTFELSEPWTGSIDRNAIARIDVMGFDLQR
jgi:hypothetical protein